MTTPNLLQQAIQAHQANHLEEAERLYRAVLQADSAQADSLSLLALVLGARGRHDEAVAYARHAVELDPKSALFAFHLGTVLTNAKKLPEGIAAFRAAIALKADLPQAHYNLANALRADDQWHEAITAYRKAIALMPHYDEAYNNLALSLVHVKEFDEALAVAKKCTEIAPGYGDGWRTLCNIAEQAKDFELARVAGEHCTRLMPDNHFAWFGYGVALCRLGRYDIAVEAFKRALALKPDRADIWDNLGQAYQSLNRLEDAEAAFRATVEAAGQTIADEDSREVDEREYGNRHWHLALIELLRGKYKQGFARYRARFEDVGGLQRPAFTQPLWKGESLRGKTILINDEQGFGDTLMLVRYLPLLKQQGANVILSTHPVLAPYLEHMPSLDKIILHHQPTGAFDVYASVFDLPHRCGTTLQAMPDAAAYLPILPPTDSTQLALTPHPKVGVVWGGSPRHANDARRSIPLPVFAEIFNHRPAEFFSLNRDLKAGDAELLPQLAVTDLAPRIKDFTDAARFIAQLDLVITCDTATAHLAGGMGKPVWVLLPFAPDWRWLTDREDSPWYPTARLFRQPRINDWAGVIQNVKAALPHG